MNPPRQLPPPWPPVRRPICTCADLAKARCAGPTTYRQVGRPRLPNPSPPLVHHPWRRRLEAPGIRKPADALAKIFSDEDEANAKSQPGSQPVVASAPTKSPLVTQPLVASAARPPLEVSTQPRSEPPALTSANSATPPPKQPAPAAGSLTGGAPPASRTAATASSAKPAQQTLPLATSFSRTPAPFVSASAASPPQAAPAQAASPSTAGTDRDWLNARFAEIAAQIERSLKENRPERALSALGQRFDKLESSLASVMTAVKARSEQGPGQGASRSHAANVGRAGQRPQDAGRRGCTAPRASRCAQGRYRGDFPEARCTRSLGAGADPGGGATVGNPQRHRSSGPRAWSSRRRRAQDRRWRWLALKRPPTRASMPCGT